MKAAVLGANGIEIRDVERPKPGPEQVLIKVRAAGLNRADLIVASGRMHGPTGGPGTILGLECAGEVAEVGSKVSGLKAGDRVMSSAAATYAEYALADMGRVHRIPANNMSFEQAATLPVGLQTMHNAVVTAGRLKAGEAVLVQGASSGVGLIAQQIAKVKGARLVIGSSTNAERREKLTSFGADMTIDSKDPAWHEQVLKATGGKGVDLIVDQISGYAANQNLKATAILGRIVNVGRLGGFHGDFDFDLHAMRRIDYIGVTFRTRSVEEVREINRLMRADIWGDVEAGRIALPIDKTFPLDEAGAALAHMKANAHFGKIVLVM
jgi:NADPH2:quinone reductase